MLTKRCLQAQHLLVLFMGLLSVKVITCLCHQTWPALGKGEFRQYVVKVAKILLGNYEDKQ